MSSPAERLDEHMTALYDGVDLETEAQKEAPQRFVVDDESKADWALRKLAKARAARRDIEAAAEVERQRIDDWAELEVATHEREEAFFTDLLTDYHRSVIEADPNAKSIKRPHGTLKSRQNPDKWEFDEDTFIEWAVEQARFFRTKVEIDKVSAKNQLTAREGKVVDPETGEVVPGVDVIPGERKFMVEIDG